MIAVRIGLAVAALSACGASADAPDPAYAYLQDRAFARDEMVASLVNPANGYSRVRLGAYATGQPGDWDRLPEWNPAAELIGADELDRPGGAPFDHLSEAAAPLEIPGAVASLDDPALVALGEAAFFRYPAQIAPYFGKALASRQAAARYGLWIDAANGVGGLVRTRMADGSTTLALTCATCHAASDGSERITPGLPNAALDMGAAIAESSGVPAPLSGDAAASWGPGRADVTTTAGTVPARIPDLRPVLWLTHLQHDATVRARDPIALAIRIETLVITANLATVRPPRVVALALAAYVRSLARGLPDVSEATRGAPDGAAVFAVRCAGCHAPPGLTGPPVPLAVVGTDPAQGESPERGTGCYRVPSLRGVATRGPLFHDGTVPSVDVLLDPARLDAGFLARLHGVGAIPGHVYGLDLSDNDRRALIAYLRAL